MELQYISPVNSKEINNLSLLIIELINGAMGWDRLGPGAFGHHNVDQSHHFLLPAACAWYPASVFRRCALVDNGGGA